jgi:uncharacterized membrane protein YqgA involved in biofilm formation
VGVMFSAISVFVYQGALTVLGMLFGALLSETMVAELTASGGLLILGIGLNLMFAHAGGTAASDTTLPKTGKNGALVSGTVRPPVVSIKIGNLLPALAWAVLIAWIVEKIGK